MSNAQRPDLLLAAMTGLDPRTIRKAIERGPDAIKGRERRERLSACAKQIGLTLGGSSSGTSDPPSGAAA